MRLLNVSIADVNFIINCSALPLMIEPQSPLYAPFTAATAGREPGSFSVDVSLEIEDFSLDGELTEIFQGSGSWSMFKKKGEYYLALNPTLVGGPECVARFGQAFEKVVIHCGKTEIVEVEGMRMVRNPFTYPLDQLIVMYFLAGREGAIVHAAGVEMDGRGYIFPGRSGAGKSTLSRLLAGLKNVRPLSDDRMAIRKIEGAFKAFGTPWAGEAGIAVNRGIELFRIFFISHGTDNKIRRMNQREALERLLPVTSIPWFDREMMSKILSFCEDMLSHIAAYELSFKPDTEVLDVFEDFLAA